METRARLKGFWFAASGAALVALGWAAPWWGVALMAWGGFRLGVGLPMVAMGIDPDPHGEEN